MKKILCGQQKGGVGKSTLAGNIAVGLARRGLRVIMIDTDKQQSCVKWGSRRKTSNIAPVIDFATLMAKRGAEGNKEFLTTFDKLDASGNFDVCIIDAGGRDNPELRLSMFVADVLLAPCLPSQADVESLQEFDEVVGDVLGGNPDLKAITVLNKCNFGLNFHTEIGLAQAAIEEMDYLSNCPAVVSERPNFRAAWLEGKSVYDLETDSARAAQEQINGVISHVYEQ